MRIIHPAAYPVSIVHALLLTVICISISCMAVSCLSGPVVVPENLATAELIQRGQEASDKNRYSHAIQYYTAVIERFPFDIDSICAAEYEIAFIHSKQKNYELAKTEFLSLLGRYNTSDAELLPPQFKILSNIVLKKIEEAENRRKKK
jgi:outer membrane protein assembly factor BamD (BamD/ComL family)